MGGFRIGGPKIYLTVNTETNEIKSTKKKPTLGKDEKEKYETESVAIYTLKKIGESKSLKNPQKSTLAKIINTSLKSKIGVKLAIAIHRKFPSLFKGTAQLVVEASRETDQICKNEGTDFSTFTSEFNLKNGIDQKHFNNDPNTPQIRLSVNPFTPPQKGYFIIHWPNSKLTSCYLYKSENEIYEVDDYGKLQNTKYKNLSAILEKPIETTPSQGFTQEV